MSVIFWVYFFYPTSLLADWLPISLLSHPPTTAIVITAFFCYIVNDKRNDTNLLITGMRVKLEKKSIGCVWSAWMPSSIDNCIIFILFGFISLFFTYKWPTSWAATMMPLKPPVSSMIATLLTFSKRLLTTQAPPT